MTLPVSSRPQTLEARVALLHSRLRDLGSLAVAFSGGVDSTLLLKVAHDVLKDDAVGLVGVSPSLPERERLETVALADQLGARVHWIETRELDEEGYRANASDRCYFCKRELHSRLIDVAQEMGFRSIADGFHIGDMQDIRPGARAAEEKGVLHPLADAGFDKEDIRNYARELSLPNWNKPAMACLSSRVPFGTAIDPALLKKIEEAEDALMRLGFQGFRVRHHDRLARLELRADQMEEAFGRREEIVDALKSVGYVYVALDLEGYRTGSWHTP